MATLTIYILFSRKRQLFYVGKTKKLHRRVLQHNKGESGFTQTGIPWTLLWSRSFYNIKEAENLERKLKNLSQSRKIKFMLKYRDGIVSIANFEELLNWTII